ncbi:hypothetical protein [Micromonospora sediminicola]|uniref:hypothetical protein n=1 Tax=Micromonospora sediminicola TaxID=946078 RepID=UPI00379D2C53
MTDRDDLDARAIRAGATAIRDAAARMPFLARMLTPTVARRWAEAAIRAAGDVYDADRAAFVDQQVAEARIAGWDMSAKGMDLRVTMARETAAGLVMAAKTFLDANPGAQNYVEQTVIDRESGDRYVILFMKPGGRSPHELRREAEAERDWLLAEAPDEMRARFHATRRKDAGSAVSA